MNKRDKLKKIARVLELKDSPAKALYKIETKTSQLEKEIGDLDKKIERVNSLQKTVEVLNEKVDEIGDLQERIDQLGLKIGDIKIPDIYMPLNALDKKIGMMAEELNESSALKEKEIYEDIEDLEKSLEEVKKNTNKLKLDQGRGGSMNRRITMSGVDVLTRYTDINFTSGTATVDDTNKRVDIAIGGEPADPDTSVQFNDGGVFGGDANFKWDKTVGQLQLGVDTSFTGDATFPLNVGINTNGYGGFYLQNTSDGDSAATDMIVGNDADGIAFSGHYGDFGINSSGFTQTDAGEVKVVSISAAGADYVAGDILTLEDGDTNCTLEVLTVGGSGDVATVEIVTSGTGYTVKKVTTSTDSAAGSGCVIFVRATYDTTVWGANDVYLYSSGGNLIIGTDDNVLDSEIHLFTGGFAESNIRLAIKDETIETNVDFYLKTNTLYFASDTYAYADTIGQITLSNITGSSNSLTLLLESDGASAIITSNVANLYLQNSSKQLALEGTHCYSNFADFSPDTDSARTLGASSYYWLATYTDSVYINSKIISHDGTDFTMDDSLKITSPSGQSTMERGIIINNEGGSDATCDFQVKSDGVDNVIWVDSSADLLYFIGATNGIKIDATGQLTMLGTGRVEKEFIIPLSGFNNGGTKPTEVIAGNALGYGFTINDVAYFSFEVPNDWDSSVDLEIAIHWYINEAYATGSGEVQWSLIWVACKEDATEDPTAAGTTTSSGDINIPATANRLTETKINIPYASLQAHDVLVFTLKRIALVGGSNPTAEPVVVSLECEYTANKLGLAI